MGHQPTLGIRLQPLIDNMRPERIKDDLELSLEVQLKSHLLQPSPLEQGDHLEVLDDLLLHQGKLLCAEQFCPLLTLLGPLDFFDGGLESFQECPLFEVPFDG